MYYKELYPHTVLSPYIRSYFHIRISSGAFHFPADGCPGLIINLGNPFLLGFEDGHYTEIQGCRLFGAQTRQLLTSHISGQTDLLAVKFNPGQIPRFFNLPAIELTNSCAPVQSFWGRHGREMEERFYETNSCNAGSIAEIKRLLEDALIESLSQDNTYDKRISAALDTIWRRKGQVRVEDLARSLYLSRRHFERLFLNFVGLAPKRFCRIIRFLGVFSAEKTIRTPNWVNLAIDNGYSDQAHLIRECKYFTGHSPRSYLNDRSSLEHAVLGTTYIMSHFFNTWDVSSATVPQTSAPQPINGMEETK